MAVVTLLCSAFLPGKILLNGKVPGIFCGVLFIAGMVFQMIQILCDGPSVFDAFYIKEPRLTKEDVEELKKLLEEYDEELG